VDPFFSEAIPAPSSDRFLDLMDPRLQKLRTIGEGGLEMESLGDHPPDGSMKGAVAVRSSLFRGRYPQMAPPLLSMKGGPANASASSAACVAHWRQWRPAGALDCDEVTLVVSIEDTGNLISLADYFQRQFR